MNFQALDLIGRALKQKETYLDLGNCDLTDNDFVAGSLIDNELRQCTHLTTLILSSSWIDYEKNTIIESENYGHANKLSVYPSALSALTNLIVLIFNGNLDILVKGEFPMKRKVAVSDMSFVKTLTKLSYLDLSNNRISEISDLSDLTSLKHLDISGNQINEIKGLKNLRSLKSLILKNNEITILEGLDNLTSLQRLDISLNLIIDLQALVNLTELQSLSVYNNQIEFILILKNLRNLMFLDIHNNSISELAGLEELTQLKYLYISGNKISSIKNIESLPTLEVLDISHNQFSGIIQVEKLKALKILNIQENELSNIEGLNHLTELTGLDISVNKITEIKNIDILQKLNWLDLSYNQVTNINQTDLPKSLTQMFIANNQITTIDFDIYLKFFSLDATYNELLATKLKRYFIFNHKSQEASELETIETRFSNKKLTTKFEKEDINSYLLGSQMLSNPLKKPPLEVVRQGYRAVDNYYESLEEKGVEYLYESKLLIVGQPRAGKTSLRFKLYDSSATLPLEDNTTRGIDIQQLTFDVMDREGKARKFNYNVWDFGGQQIYQTTHQFFLTHRSLYILVMDTGKDSIGNDDTTINYWLQVVELLGGSSPLLLVKNEKNQRQVNIDLSQKKERFNFLKNDYNIDLNALVPGTVNYDENKAKDFCNLKEDIETELKRLPMVGFPMPRNWVEIRNKLYIKSKMHPYITKHEYMQICTTFSVSDYERQMELSHIFHDLGIFLHFQDYNTLDDFIILQNVWATDAVFAIFDNKEVQDSKGKFTDLNLSSIWRDKGYEPVVYKKLLALMMQFELCYQVDNAKPSTYIVPEMLADKTPQGYIWKNDNDLPLQYRYDFMPKGILTRFIVRLNKHIMSYGGQQMVWKTGVAINGSLLDCPDTVAEVLEAWDNKQISILVQGKFAKDLLNKITYEIDDLNDKLFRSTSANNQGKKSKWYKMIPCNCSVCMENVDKHFFDHSKLLERKNFGKDTIECEKRPYEVVSINELLEGNYIKKEKLIKSKNENLNQGKKIFISYAHLDEYWKDEFKKHLTPLKDQKLISSWTDREIEAGFWDLQIENAIENADIFLLLITHNFLASSYITSKEIVLAYSRFQMKKLIIFPIICDSCLWKLKPITEMELEYNETEKKQMFPWLGKFKAFPKDGKPIKNWNNRQEGFLDVINELLKYL